MEERAPKVWSEPFGRLLVQLRTNARLSQAEAARRAGIDAPLLLKYERGYRQSPDPVFLLRIADAYGASLRGLIKALEFSRTHTSASFPEVFDVYQAESDGPSPAVAKAQIQKAQARLLRAFHALEEIIEPSLGGQTTGPRRRKTDRLEDGGETG